MSSQDRLDQGYKLFLSRTSNYNDPLEIRISEQIARLTFIANVSKNHPERCSFKEGLDPYKFSGIISVYTYLRDQTHARTIGGAIHNIKTKVDPKIAYFWRKEGFYDKLLEDAIRRRSQPYIIKKTVEEAAEIVFEESKE